MKSNKNKRNNFLLYVIIFIAIILVALNYIGSDKGIFGFTTRIVVTGSMEPTIQTNSLNVIRLCSIDDIEVNDIICFNYGQDITHRVLEKTVNDSGVTILHTKGDANDAADSIEVNDDMLVGKVIKTFNGTSSIIEKYSITPGQIDGLSLSKTVIIYLIILSLIISVLICIVEYIVTIIRTVSSDEEYYKKINKFADDINSIAEYSYILGHIESPVKTKDKSKNREIRLYNTLAKAKTIKDLNEFHLFTKQFKKAIEHNLIINELWRTNESTTEIKRNFVMYDLKSNDTEDNSNEKL